MPQSSPPRAGPVASSSLKKTSRRLASSQLRTVFSTGNLEEIRPRLAQRWQGLAANTPRRHGAARGSLDRADEFGSEYPMSNARAASPVAFLLNLVFFLGCLPTPAPVLPENATLAHETIDRLAKGVFEVVTPKLEDEGVQYQDPLPLQLLPFLERNSKFLSRGTAFAISENRFATAAHVLPAGDSLKSRYYLRDAAGATYEIGHIIKYSPVPRSYRI